MQLGFSIRDVEEIYKSGQKSFHEDYKYFYNKVNAIEKKFGFEITQYDDNTADTTGNFTNNSPFYGYNFNPNSIIYIQQNRIQYKVTNIFKSHDSKKIFLSINQKNSFKSANSGYNFRSNSIPLTYRNEANVSYEISIPKPLSRNYDFTVSEFKEIIHDLDSDTQIYVLKKSRAYAFGLVMHYDINEIFKIGGDPKKKLIIEIDMFDDESKYNKIKIDNSYFFDLHISQLDDIITYLKMEDLITDGFFEAGNFYYFGEKEYENVEYNLNRFIEREVNIYYSSDRY